MTYPSLFNGFEKKFKGTWSVGLLLKVPLWEWGEGRNTGIAAAPRAAATMRERDIDGIRMEDSSPSMVRL